MVIRARTGRRAGSTIAVVDDGGGLPAELQRWSGPTGLGLQIVRTLVDSELGGSLSLGLHRTPAWGHAMPSLRDPAGVARALTAPPR